MYHRNRTRSLVVLALALLLTVALASVVAAQVPPPPPPPPGFGGTPTTDPNAPPPPPGFGGSTPAPGGGVPPPATEHGLIKPVIYPWPPPNAIVLHPATPIQLSQAGSGLRVYFINRDGTSKIGPFFDNFTILANTHHGEPVTLYEGSNPGTGKPVTIDYLPAERRLRVSTFYADRPPHDFNKPYVFTVDADHNVKHLQW